MTRELLRSILDRQSAVCVSLMLPVNPRSEPAKNDLRLGNLIREARKQLENLSCGPEEIEHILYPLSRALDQTPGKNMHAVVAYATAYWSVTDCIPSVQKASVTAGPNFNVRPLLPLLPMLGQVFYILAVNETAYRLVECDICAGREVLSGTASEEEASEFQLQAHTSGARHGRARSPVVFHSGGYDSKDQVVRFFHDASHAIERLLNGSHSPLIIVAPERMLALYRSVNKYRNVLSNCIAKDPEHWKVAELHETALPVFRQYFLDKEVAPLFSGPVAPATDNCDIIRSASEGRVDVLAIATEADLWGTVSDADGTVQFSAESSITSEDLINRVAVETLRHGGSAVTIPRVEMPERAKMAARYRY